MKTGMILLAALSFALCGACKDGLFPSSSRPVLPELPAAWKELLGEPHWRLEWIDEGGSWRELELPPGGKIPGLSLPREWTTPALAWPFWPARGLLPGMMRPAGALFPWNAEGETLLLSWKGGVEAFFWKELAAAAGSSAAESRLPWHFDWPRFAQTLDGDESIPGAVRQDPWLADWAGIAKKTANSGFDRRRVAPGKSAVLAVPGMEGLWIGASPFSPPLEAEGGVLLLNVTEIPGVWASAKGTLKCSRSGWVFRGTAN